MNTTIKVQCACGQLSLSFGQPPVTQLVCHCQDCRDVSDQPFANVAFFRAEADCVQGHATAQHFTGGSGKPKQYRKCQSCGDFVYATVDVLSGLIGVNADRIAPPFEFRPMAHVWTCEKVQGVNIPEGVMQFSKAPAFRPGA